MSRFDNLLKSYVGKRDEIFELYFEQEEQGYQDNGSGPYSSVDEFVNEEIGKWMETALPEERGISPRELIGKIATLEEAAEAFKSAAIICEGMVPDLVAEKFAEFGTAAEDALLGMLNQTEDYSTFRTSQYTDVSVMKLIAKWGMIRGIPFLIGIIRRSSGKDDYIPDVAVEALSDIGEPSVEPLLKEVRPCLEALKSACVAGVSGAEEESDTPEKFIQQMEYYLEALVNIAEKNNDPRVYPVIRDYFLYAPDKGYALAFLEILKDMRGITLLRGYLEKNKGSIGYADYLAVRRCIEALGGNAGDIYIDFSDDPEYRDYLQKIDSKRKNTGISVGRNDPCPCGSGKKYKKCCGK